MFVCRNQMKLFLNFGIKHHDKRISVKFGDQKVGLEHLKFFFRDWKEYVFLSKTIRDISALFMTLVNINGPVSEIRQHGRTRSPTRQWASQTRMGWTTFQKEKIPIWACIIWNA